MLYKNTRVGLQDKKYVHYCKTNMFTCNTKNLYTRIVLYTRYIARKYVGNHNTDMFIGIYVRLSGPPR
jgi:hypothetical protein